MDFENMGAPASPVGMSGCRESNLIFKDIACDLQPDGSDGLDGRNLIYPIARSSTGFAINVMGARSLCGRYSKKVW